MTTSWDKVSYMTGSVLYEQALSDFLSRYYFILIRRLTHLNKSFTHQLNKERTSVKLSENQIGDAGAQALVSLDRDEAEKASKKAIEESTVKVYRGRIMLVGQDRAGKTSLKKRLLGLPFDDSEPSTIGIEVASTVVNVSNFTDNWEPAGSDETVESQIKRQLAVRVADQLKRKKESQDVAGVNESLQTKKDEDSTKSQLEGQDISMDESLQRDESKKSQTHEGESQDIAGITQMEPPMSEDNPSDDLKTLLKEVAPTDFRQLSPLILEELKQTVEKKAIKENEMVVDMWDFAGQELYLVSHTSFLVNSAAYIVVHNLDKPLNALAMPVVRKEGCDEPLQNTRNETNLDNVQSWLTTIHSIGDQMVPGENSGEKENKKHVEDLEGKSKPYQPPPVLIVGTHADKSTKEEINQVNEEIKSKLVGKAYECHVLGDSFFAVDNSKNLEDNKVLQRLRAKLVEVLKQEACFGQTIPIKWFKFEEAIRALKKKEIFCLTRNEAEWVAKKVCKVVDDSDVDAVLSFYHEAGVIVQFGDTVVLDARWLINMFTKLISFNPFEKEHPSYKEWSQQLEQKGMINKPLVNQLFKEHVGKQQTSADIISMMQVYGLLAEVSVPVGGNKETKILVPSLLKTEPPQEVTDAVQTRPLNSLCPLYIEFPDGYVVPAFFPQFLVYLIHWSFVLHCSKLPKLYQNYAVFTIGLLSEYDLHISRDKTNVKALLVPNPSIEASFHLKRLQVSEVHKFLAAIPQMMTHDLRWFRNMKHEIRSSDLLPAGLAKKGDKSSSVDLMCETISQIDSRQKNGKSPLEKLESAYQGYQERFFNANVVKPFQLQAKMFKRFLYKKEFINDEIEAQQLEVLEVKAQTEVFQIVDWKLEGICEQVKSLNDEPKIREVDHKVFSETFEVGEEGGLLSFCGCTVDIPPGALSTETSICLSIAQIAPPDGIRVTPILHCEPDGLQFNRDVEIMLPLNGSPVNILGQAELPELELMVCGSIEESNEERWHSAKVEKLSFSGMFHRCNHFSLFFWRWTPRDFLFRKWYRCVSCLLFEESNETQTIALKAVVCETNLETAMIDKLEKCNFRMRDAGQTIQVMWGQSLAIDVQTDTPSPVQFEPTKECVDHQRFEGHCEASVSFEASWIDPNATVAKAVIKLDNGEPQLSYPKLRSTLHRTCKKKMDTGEAAESSRGIGDESSQTSADGNVADLLLFKLSKMICDNWEEVALRLGFDLYEVDGVKDEKSNSSGADKAREMLKQWKQSNGKGKGATKNVLAVALTGAGLAELADFVWDFRS